MKRLNAPYYLSAYGIARQNGFEGTEEEWLASLKGDEGPQGPRGPQGVMGLTGERGKAGKNGWTYVPHVDESGNIGWQTVMGTEGLPGIIPTMNIRGPEGPRGPAYELTDGDKERIAATVMELLEITPDKPNQSIEGRTLPADWAQNDTESSDYVKNRPMHDYETEVLPLTVTVLSEGYAQLPITIEGDCEYEVSFNGSKYVCTSVDFAALGGIIYIGNDGLMGNDSNRTEPFCIIYTVDDSTCTLMVSDATAYSCSVSIVRRDTVKLHQRFLPYSPAMGDTLYWDGTVDINKVTVVPGTGGTQIYVKVSDVVLTEAELINGVTIRENLAGSNVSSDFAGPLSFPEDGALWLGLLLPTVAIVGKDRDDMEAGIYFAVTVADLGLGMMEFKALSLTVPGCSRFYSALTLPNEAAPKYVDALCVQKIIFRSSVGKLFSLGISDDGQAQILPVGISQT